MTTSAGSLASTDASSAADDEGGRSGHERRPWWRQRHRIIAVSLTVALLTGGVTAFTVVGSHSEAAKSAALDSLTIATASQVEAIEAAVTVSLQATTALTESEGQVADDQVRMTLAEALKVLEVRIASARALDLETADDETRAITMTAAAVQDSNDALGAATQTTHDSLQALLSAQEAWKLNEATTAYQTTKTQLGDLVASSSAVLGETAGKVTDDGVRVSLSEALEASTELLFSEPDLSTVELVTEASTAVAASLTTLTHAMMAVQDATAAWTTEATARQNAEDEAARDAGSHASEASTPRPDAEARRSNQTPSDDGSAQHESPSSPAPQPEWTIIEEDVPFEHDQCGDTFGNVWDC